MVSPASLQCFSQCHKSRTLTSEVGVGVGLDWVGFGGGGGGGGGEEEAVFAREVTCSLP